jgi:hypothetical protein
MELPMLNPQEDAWWRINHYTYKATLDLMDFKPSKVITYLSLPKSANYDVVDDSFYLKKIHIEIPTIKAEDMDKHSLNIYFRTNDMVKPTLLYEESDLWPNEVAVGASLTATFENDPD